jgi:hypothetical protein
VGSPISQAGEGGLFSPPEVAIHLVKMVCERPELAGRSLSQWDCSELARKLIEEGVVSSISTETVRRVLSHHKLKPWRQHLWLSPKHPRDAAFYEAVTEIIDLYSRPLVPHEVVLCVDEKTSLQPRSLSGFLLNILIFNVFLERMKNVKTIDFNRLINLRPTDS